MTFFNKTIAKRTPPGQRQSVQHEGMRSFVAINIRIDRNLTIHYVHESPFRPID